jgi:N-acetylglucosaminyldiphosphoundecaprenol N-acetyl-beta-D-mannosaminyltransferase
MKIKFCEQSVSILLICASINTGVLSSEMRMRSGSVALLGTPIDPLSWEQALGRILRWASARQSRMICLCNVHVVVSARHDEALAQALQLADMSTPDGAPVAWLMRKIGWPEQQRISGPDLMWRLIAEAVRLQLPVFLLGSTETTLARLTQRLQQVFPDLQIAGMLSPPFRQLSATEDAQMVEIINNSGARLLFVGLGCPKQEIWMAAQRDRVQAVMLGVGAAFDYHAGVLPRAPQNWQRLGLEWLYRLWREPTRLIKRYLVTNSLFLLALPGELWRRTRH